MQAFAISCTFITCTRNVLHLGFFEFTHFLTSLPGRAIRHRSDYACIVLCDRRYARSSTLQKLPEWIRSSTRTHSNFGPAFASIRKVRMRSYTHACTLDVFMSIFTCGVWIRLKSVLWASFPFGRILEWIITLYQVTISGKITSLEHNALFLCSWKINCWAGWSRVRLCLFF